MIGWIQITELSLVTDKRHAIHCKPVPGRCKTWTMDWTMDWILDTVVRMRSSRQSMFLSEHVFFVRALQKGELEVVP